MGENVVTLAVVGRLLQARWRVLAALAVLGAVVGALLGLVLAPGYEATSKVLLQGDRDEKQMLGEAQIAMSLVVLDRTAAALGGSGADLQGVLTAAVAEGNVIELRGAAPTPEAARQLTERATAEYIGFSAQIASDTANAAADVTQRSRDAVQQRIDDANRKITDLQATPVGTTEVVALQIDQLRNQVADSTKELDSIDERSQNEEITTSLGRAGSSIIEPATAPTGAASPTVLQLVVVGAVGLALAGVLAHLAALRADRRIRRRSDIEAALGVPVLGTVEVPVGLSRPVHGNRFARAVHDDRRWATTTVTAGDGGDQVLFYRRVLDRLRSGDAPHALLVLVADDDQDARLAAVRLAVAAQEGATPVGVITDDADVAAAVHTVAAGPDGRPSAIVTGGDETPSADAAVIHVVAVPPARPSIPDVDGGVRTIVVLTPGTRTGWELVALSGACADAGRTLAGVLVSVPVSVPVPAPDASGPAEATPAHIDVMAGSP